MNESSFYFSLHTLSLILKILKIKKEARISLYISEATNSLFCVSLYIMIKMWPLFFISIDYSSILVTIVSYIHYKTIFNLFKSPSTSNSCEQPGSEQFRRSIFHITLARISHHIEIGKWHVIDRWSVYVCNTYINWRLIATNR